MKGEITSSQCSKSDVIHLRLDAIRSVNSPRLDGIDVDHVRALAETEEKLPPILVERRTMSVIDGAHRLESAKIVGRDTIEAVFFDGSAEEAFRISVKANITHGLPLSRADRHAAAERLVRLQPGQSDRSIASVTGLAAKTIAGIRVRMLGAADAHARIGRDGRVRPLSTTEGRQVASAAIAAKPDASLRELAEISGLSVGTVRDVRARVLAGENPVPPKQRSIDKAPVRGRHLRSGSPPAGPNSIDALLHGLRRDPSLRYTNAGRTFLMWLSNFPSVLRWQEVTQGLPPHCGVMVARIAREYSEAWQQLANEMEHRSDCA